MDFRLSHALVAVGLVAAAPGTLVAQDQRVEEEVRWFFGFPSWTLELYGGVASTGRLVLQSLDGDDGLILQRELRAGNSFSYGGSVAATILPRTAARLAFTRTSADLNYRDDTGTGRGNFDDDDVAGLSSNVVSLEIIRYLLPARVRVTPYAGVGVALVWWNLDPHGPPTLISTGGGDTQLRSAGVGVAGLQYRVSDRWAVRFEATGFSVSNPFTGEDSYIPLTGFTIDEPTRVNQGHFRLSGTYTFATPDRPEN